MLLDSVEMKPEIITGWLLLANKIGGAIICFEDYIYIQSTWDWSEQRSGRRHPGSYWMVLK